MLYRIKNIFQHRAILKNLVIKNLRGRYAGSAFGMLWTVINPLILAIIIAFIFTEIMKVNINNFYLFIISGILPWAFFAGSLQESSTSIADNASLLKQFSFPRELIPMASVLTNAINLFIGLLAVTPFFIAVNPKVFFLLPMLFLVILLHLIFTSGLAFILSSSCVHFKDIGHVLNMMLLFWLWLTPVFYDMSMVPAKYLPLFSINPVTPYITLYRSVFFDVALPGLKVIVTASFLALCSFCLGYSIFIKQESSFLKRL